MPPPGSTATSPTKHECETPTRTAQLAAAELAGIGAERSSQLGACCFQFLPRRDQRQGEFVRSLPDVNAEPLQPLFLQQATKHLLCDLDPQAGPLPTAMVALAGGTSCRYFALVLVHCPSPVIANSLARRYRRLRTSPGFRPRRAWLRGPQQMTSGTDVPP